MRIRHKIIRSVIVIIFLTVINFIYLAHNTYAQTPKQIIKISPVILSISLSPGQTHEYKVKVENLLNLPLPVNISVEGFDPSDEDYGFSPNTPPSVSPLVKWISIDQPDLLLTNNGIQEVTIRITTPSEVPIGGYFAMIYFQPLIASADVPINARIGLLTLANIGVQDENAQKAQIETFEFKKWLFEASPVEATIRVKNIALNYFTAKPKLTIKPLFGEEKEVFLEEKTILPGKIRRWQPKLTLDKPFMGIYLTKLSISTGGGNQTISTKQFYALPLSPLLMGIVIFAIITFVLIFRKRVRKAIKLLIKG